MYADVFPLVSPASTRFSPNGQHVVVLANDSGPAAALFDANNLALRATCPLPAYGDVSDACFDPAHTWLLIGFGGHDGGVTWRGNVIVWHLAQQEAWYLSERDLLAVVSCELDPVTLDLHLQFEADDMWDDASISHHQLCVPAVEWQGPTRPMDAPRWGLVPCTDARQRSQPDAGRSWSAIYGWELAAAKGVVHDIRIRMAPNASASIGLISDKRKRPFQITTGDAFISQVILASALHPVVAVLWYHEQCSDSLAVYQLLMDELSQGAHGCPAVAVWSVDSHAVTRCRSLFCTRGEPTTLVLVGGVVVAQLHLPKADDIRLLLLKHGQQPQPCASEQARCAELLAERFRAAKFVG